MHCSTTCNIRARVGAAAARAAAAADDLAHRRHADRQTAIDYSIRARTDQRVRSRAGAARAAAAARRTDSVGRPGRLAGWATTALKDTRWRP